MNPKMQILCSAFVLLHRQYNSKVQSFVVVLLEYPLKLRLRIILHILMIIIFNNSLIFIIYIE